jgi:hypothetical protein
MANTQNFGPDPTDENYMGPDNIWVRLDNGQSNASGPQASYMKLADWNTNNPGINPLARGGEQGAGYYSGTPGESMHQIYNRDAMLGSNPSRGWLADMLGPVLPKDPLSALMFIGSLIAPAFAPGLGQALGGAMGGVGSALSGAGQSFAGALGSLSPALGGAAQAIGAPLAGAGNAIGQAFGIGSQGAGAYSDVAGMPSGAQATQGFGSQMGQQMGSQFDNLNPENMSYFIQGPSQSGLSSSGMGVGGGSTGASGAGGSAMSGMAGYGPTSAISNLFTGGVSQFGNGQGTGQGGNQQQNQQQNNQQNQSFSIPTTPFSMSGLNQYGDMLNQNSPNGFIGKKQEQQQPGGTFQGFLDPSLQQQNYGG